ncbi:MAG: guanylate kinase [Planctomycetota bacterium]|nr:guanylate kinase [Planctomycetota bacterium]MCZ6851198.1 guanylate kinase [Planctomycetota bacterium]
MACKSNKPRGLLLAISGPSGVGKTTITRELERRLDGVFSVSATTRPQAPGEVDGRDYHFLTERQFEDMVDRGAFLEHAQVYAKHRYGTPREPVERHLAQGRLVLLDIDVQGAILVRQTMPEALMFFILPPNDEDLLLRLRHRGREAEAAIRHRFNEAKHEIELGMRSGVYDAQIVNDDLPRAIDEVCRLVQQRRATEKS